MFLPIIDDLRRRLPCFQYDIFKHKLVFLKRVTANAQEKNKSCRPSQLVLAWLLTQGEDIVITLELDDKLIYKKILLL